MRKQCTYGDETKEKAFALLASGMLCSQVAKQLNIPYTTVKTWEKKWESESVTENDEEVTKNLVALRNAKKEEFARSAWDIIEKANDLLMRRLDRALDCEDIIDSIVEDVLEADKDDMSYMAKKAVLGKLRAIKVEDIREIATVIGTIYDKQALANKEATEIVEGGIQVEFNIPRPPKEVKEE